jgi:AAA+ ATPase superfamily predicted ATPase
MAELQRVLSHKGASKLVIVYGRRRLGKSTLIRQVLTDDDVYYMAGMYSAQVQLSLLASQLADKFPALAQVQFPGWEALLSMLNSLATERFTLCLDEFPYMVKGSPELPSVLQKLIDSKQLKYHILICGSSQRMMGGFILSASEPLYGRSSCTIKLQPIPIRYLEQVLPQTSQATVEEHSVWGGVPRYWELRLERESQTDALRHVLASTNGALYGEPERLFLDDIDDTSLSQSILSVIAAGANRISEIAGRLGKDATTLSTPVRRLMDMGYIRREVPFGESFKSSKRGIYLIHDPLIRFYYTFIVPQASNISRGRTETVMQQIEEGRSRYVSQHWEHLCREAVSGNRVLGKCWGEASRWWGSVPLVEPDERGQKFRSMEVDLVAESTDHRSLLIGECKWTHGEHAGRLLHQLQEKARLLPFAQGKELIFALFLKEPPQDTDFEGNVFLSADVIAM